MCCSKSIKSPISLPSMMPKLRLTWQPKTFLGKVGKHSCYCYPPAVASNGKDLTVVWTDFSQDRKGLNIRLYGIPMFKKRKQLISSVVCRTSDDNGRTWGREDVLAANAVSKEMEGEIDNPSLLADGECKYLFWIFIDELAER